MEFSVIIAGLVFLLNPMVSIIDVLPDFIGCALILWAINRLSAISPELDDCRPYFKYMLYLSLLRTLTVFGNPGFDDVTRLSISLLFGAAEFGLGLMAVRSLYDGIEYLNIRYGGKPKPTPEFKYLGIAFFAVRTAFCIIPQLGALAVSNEDEMIISADQTMTDWASYTSILTLLNVLITLIVAVFWLVTAIGYIGSLSKDGNFSAVIKNAYDLKRQTDPGFFIRRTLVFAFTVALSGSFFLCDVIGDGRNLIPDFIFAGLFVWVLFLLRSYADTKKAMIAGAAYFIFSVADFINYDLYMKRRYFASFRFILDNFASEYYISVAFTVLSSVSLCVFAYFLYEPLKETAKKYIVPEVPAEFVRSARDNEKYIGTTVILIKVFLGLVTLTALSSVALTAVFGFFPEYWMIHLAVNIAAFVLAVIVFSRMIGGVKRRYPTPDGD